VTPPCVCVWSNFAESNIPDGRQLPEKHSLCHPKQKLHSLFQRSTATISMGKTSHQGQSAVFAGVRERDCNSYMERCFGVSDSQHGRGLGFYGVRRANPRDFGSLGMRTTDRSRFQTTTPGKDDSPGVGLIQAGTVRQNTASPVDRYSAVVLQQADPVPQQGLSGKQQSVPSVQQGFAVVQHAFPDVQHVPAPSWQHSPPAAWQHSAPGGQHPQQLVSDEACDRTPKPMRPNTPAQANVNTERRNMTISRI